MPEFEAIYDRYFEFVWNSARRLGVQASFLDDVVQEVFLVIHSRLGELRQPEALRSWIYGIVRRAASTHRRKHASSVQSLSENPVEATLQAKGPSPHDQAELSSQEQILGAILARMTEPKREVFMLVELEEMSVPEAAEALQIPLNTAYSRLRHARAEFEVALARWIEASGEQV